MDNSGKNAANEYQRKWRAANKDKTREYRRRYWEKKAAQQAADANEAAKEVQPNAGVSDDRQSF